MATTIHVEQALIGQVKQRDREAFLELYDRTITDVSRLVTFLLDDPSGLQDVIQEIYIAVYRALPTFDTEKPFHPWLMGIVVRQVNAHRRRNWRLYRMRKALNRSARQEHEPDVAEHVADSLQGKAIVESVRNLSLKLRSVVVLHYLHEYARDEIATILGIPPGTVASRLRLALETLRRKHGNQLSESEAENNGL